MEREREREKLKRGSEREIELESRERELQRENLYLIFGCEGLIIIWTDIVNFHFSILFNQLSFPAWGRWSEM